MTCPYCPTVNKLCFWGARPERPWKRPVLLVLALLLSGGSGALLWMLRDRPNYLLFAAVGGLFLMASILSVLVALHGCDACVARLFGEVS